jgi:hypothetical protein
MTRTLSSINKHIERNGGRQGFGQKMCNQNKHMLKLLHGKSRGADRSHDAECSVCGEKRSWATLRSFVGHEQNCKGEKPRAKPDLDRRYNFIADCSTCGYERTWSDTHAFRGHQKSCTGKAPRSMKGWKKV